MKKIIISHGNTASGLLNSAEMIIGKHEDVYTCQLLPQDAPEEFGERLLQFTSNDDEVLFLADLLNGTPYNQAKLLLADHHDWALVSGANLSMVIEAIMSNDSAIDTANRIINVSNITAYPVKEVQLAEKENVSTSGKMEFVLARVDSRLLHGQVATSWCKETNPNRIIVVSDTVCHDELRKNLIIQAAPSGIKGNVVPINKIIEVKDDARLSKVKALLLFETVQEALTAVKAGLPLKSINLGSIAQSEDRVTVTDAIAMNKDDLQTIKQLIDMDIEIDIRKVAADSKQDINEFINKAQQILGE